MSSYSKKIFPFLIFVFVFSELMFGQYDELRIYSGKDVFSIPAVTKGENVYFSIEDFAKAVSVNTYFNSKTKKIELKFSDYKLKVTAGNPFFIFTTLSTNKAEIHQLPNSSIIINNKIFISLRYILPLFERALGRNFTLAGKYKLVLGGAVNVTNDVVVKTEPPVKKYQYGITGIDISEKSNGTLIRISAVQKIDTYNSTFNDGELKIIFRDVNTKTDDIKYNNSSSLIKDVTVRNINDDSEFIIKVNDDYVSSDVINADKGNDLLILLHNKILATTTTDVDKNKEKWNFDVIVIDAGHGGIDGGTLGVNNIKEKDVNLGIALKLGNLLEKNMKDVKVVYTRKTDVAVDLYERGKFANEQGGNLFISIHCNSTPKKPSSANGFEIYLLRPGKTEQAISIAERENSVIKYEKNPARYKKLTDENFILVSMAQSSYMKYSEKFSDILNKEMNRIVKENSRGLKQAGFYVLVGASMPSVLIESGYLSNKNEAKYLSSKEGQIKIAQAIFNSINIFKSQYEKSLSD
ncbi:MAG: hypothetical protein CO128_00570 [Ignavibacteriales bacterium CG_4_9_14_3_um_filter_30_11]|nr:MAG: hypothetical protein CO128_00570 [Ignavibacteriales bacterium CG_4_9_14_3_um_filter_30_11]